VQELVSAVSVAQEKAPEPEPIETTPEPVVLAVNHGAASAEPLTTRPPRRLSLPLILLSGGALLAAIAIAVLLNSGDKQTQPAATAVKAQPAATQTSPPQGNGPTLATVYLRLRSNETVKLNGEVLDVKPSNNGYASLNLAAGNYRIEVQQQDGVHAQQLEINRAGTWLINPPRGDK